MFFQARILLISRQEDRMNTISPIAFTYAPLLRGPNVSEAVRKADPKNILGSGELHPAFRSKVEQLIDVAAANGM